MNRKSLFRGGLLFSFLLVSACSSPPGFGDDDGSDAASPDGSTDDDASDGSQTDTAPSNDAGTTPDVQDAGTIVADSGDGFGASRTACINEINKLRATESHAAYKLWETSAIDTCVDEQATYDQTNNSAHDAWLNNIYPTCNGNAQDECLGYGTSPSEVVACLDSMWNERTQTNCSNCAACNGPKLTQTIINCFSTKTCDFYGNYGSECGHYVNMSADYFVEAACGFSTKSGSGGWATQNFQ